MCAHSSHEKAFESFKSADNSHPFTLKSRWREKTNEIFCQTLDPDFQPSGLVIFGFCSSSSGTMSGVGSIINRSRFVLILEGLILPFGARWCPKISSIFLNPLSSAKGLTGAFFSCCIFYYVAGLAGETTKRPRRFFCQQSSVCSLQTGISSP